MCAQSDYMEYHFNESAKRLTVTTKCAPRTGGLSAFTPTRMPTPPALPRTLPCHACHSAVSTRCGCGVSSSSRSSSLQTTEKMEVRKDASKVWRGIFAILIVIPLMIIAASIPLGVMLAALEKWDFVTGFEYVISSVRFNYVVALAHH